MTAVWNLTQFALSGALLALCLCALAYARYHRRAVQRLQRFHERMALQLQQFAQYQAQLEILSNVDALTGLSNDQHLTQRLHEAMTRAARTELSVGLLRIGIDLLGHRNDDAAFPAGDPVLLEVAARLRALPREGDTVARLGGDEFAIVLADMQHPENAAVLALKVLDALKAPVLVNGSYRHLSASIGVSVCPGDGDDASTLLQCASVARQRAAGQGAGPVQSFTPELGQRALARATLEQELYRALEQDEFELHYQPQLSLETGNVIGVEALLRWRHPEQGLLAPAHFLEVAEASGQIVPIGAWVLRTACAQTAAWHRAGYWPTVGVNISARQMQLSTLGATVGQVLGSCGLDPVYLELELTERAMLAGGDLNATLAVLRQLKQLGVCLTLDNFGSGHTSLSLLTGFPIDVIKIDRSIVAALPDGCGAGSTVLAVIAMARALGQKTMAEGVETLAQLDFLDQSGCDAMQGHYFSPALTAQDMTLLLEQIGRDYHERLRGIAATARRRAG